MFMYWFTNYNTPEMTNHMLKGSLLNGKGRGTGDWLDLVGAGFPPLKEKYISHPVPLIRISVSTFAKWATSLGRSVTLSDAVPHRPEIWKA